MLFSALVSQMYPELSLLIIVSVAFLFILSAKLEWGLYLMAFFLPVIDWHFVFYRFEIPFIDLLALLVLTAFIIRKAYILFFKKEDFSLVWPIFWPFVFFFSAIMISGVFSDYPTSSVWYGIRWVLFPYLAYVLMPVNIIKKGRVLKKTLFFFFVSGVVVSLMGMASIFIGEGMEFVRVRPLAIFGIFPLGANHNLIAETLVVTSFFTLAFSLWLKNERLKKIINVLVIAQGVVLLATFSRAGWIALFCQVLLYLFIKGRETFKKALPVFLLVIILSFPLMAYMYRLQNEYSVGVSSTENRLLMYQIAWEGFKERPLLGQGSGDFLELVNQNIRFRAQYGKPLDSHGVWQKILAENGLLGLFAFVFLVLVIFKELSRELILVRKKRRKMLLLLTSAAVLGIFVMISFNTSYYKGKLFLPIGISLAIVNMIKEERNEK